MMVTVHLDQLYSYSHDPKAVAQQLAAMQKRGLRLNVHVKDPQTAEVFKYLPKAAAKAHNRRLNLAILLTGGLIASAALIGGGVMGLLPYL